MDPDLPIEKTIADVAASQRGHVARRQLLDLGLGAEAIKYRIRSGRLLTVYPGVYAVGHRRPHPVDRCMAAVLACGPGAILSHGSAASLWGFFKHWDEPFEVTVARDRRPTDILVHRCQLAPADKKRHLGVPVTSPARTVLDVAPRLRNLPRLVNDALLSPWLTQDQLAEAITRHPRGGHVSQILFGAPSITRSALEDKFVAWCQRFGFHPEINAMVDGREVDAFFRAEGVIIELDGYDFHKDRGTFERDREKDAIAAAGGLITVRITDHRLEHAAEREASRLRAILDARRA